MKSLQLYAYSHLTRDLLLSSLEANAEGGGSCLVGRRTISGSTLELQIEVQRAAIFDFYADLVGTGLELTREAHLALATLCSSPRHPGGDWTASGVVSLNLTLCFLEGRIDDPFLLSCSIPA